MIDAIVFDVDDTLYDQQLPFEQAVQAAFPLADPLDLPNLYLRFRYHSDQTFEKVISHEWSLAKMRSYRISQALTDLDYPLITKEQAVSFQKAYESALDQIQLQEEVKRTLDFLQRQQVPLGLITNGPVDHQTKKIKQLELLRWIPRDHVIISEATGFQKPQPEIFQIAQHELFAMEDKTILYVGDSFENDVVGAKRAGWKVLWFNHRMRPVPNGERPIQDIELTSFDQLFQTIQDIFA